MPDISTEKSIFLHAAGLKSVERDAYVDGACGHEPVVRARVEALLAAHDRLGGDTPPAVSHDTTAASGPTAIEKPGILLAGRYKLVEQIGEGGDGNGVPGPGHPAGPRRGGQGPAPPVRGRWAGCHPLPERGPGYRPASAPGCAPRPPGRGPVGRPAVPGHEDDQGADPE